MKDIIKAVMFGAVIGSLAFVGLDYAMGVPTVKMSYSTNTCVEVENYPTILFGTSKFNCENMPSKFNHVWVQ